MVVGLLLQVVPRNFEPLGDQWIQSFGKDQRRHLSVPP
jgi:hypothetical protein